MDAEALLKAEQERQEIMRRSEQALRDAQALLDAEATFNRDQIDRMYGNG